MSHLLIAPFSNSTIRDWPADHFARLIAIVAARWPGEIAVVGTASQWTRAAEIVRECDGSRVHNLCGKISWAEVEKRVRTAACVLGNNSGIAHLSAEMGVPTVCVFGGSHQRLEWRPIGRKVVVITDAIACSPCHLDHRDECPYDKACLRGIAPATVADVVLDMLAGSLAIAANKELARA